jgi:SAM-dependent methyltransferase
MLNAKWDELTRDFMKPAAEELLHVLQLAGHELVLDITPQTGRSGAYIAAHHTPISGTKHLETFIGDVCKLPYEDNTFDAISCAYGFMFFPDGSLAAKEMYRVLKPGARIAVTVWNVPEKNTWLTNILNVVGKNKLFPPTDGPPGTFRCVEDRYLLNLFIQAGFRNIQIGVVKGRLLFPSAEMYWEMMTAVGGPVFARLNGMEPALLAKIKYEVYESLDEQFGRDNIQMESNALLLYAEKK